MYIATYKPTNEFIVRRERRSFPDLQLAYNWLDSLPLGHKEVYYKEYAFANGTFINSWYS